MNLNTYRMTEQLLHYVWHHKLWPLHPLATTDGRSLDIIDVGLPNSDAGPDFFNAKMKIDGQLWVGNVEIHLRASDWFRHHHDTDNKYDNVVLHVVNEADSDVTTASGRHLATLVLPVPERIKANYCELQSEERYPPCYRAITDIPTLTIHSWLSALQIERLEQKTSEILHRVELCDGSWERACFVTLARNFGFGVNTDVFEQWALSIPLDRTAAHHRDNRMQIEALFFGQAGLLDVQLLSKSHQEAASNDAYLSQLSAEYQFMQHKYGVRSINPSGWRFLRMRPQNFPHVRLAQLASIYCSGCATISRLTECSSIDDVRREFAIEVTPYWQTHYMFGRETTRSLRHLSKSSIDLIAINTVAPMLFAYGRHRADEMLTDRSTALLETLKAENNNVVRMWQECGLTAQSAADSQALLQLKRKYCDRHDCLRCRIGYEYLKKK